MGAPQADGTHEYNPKSPDVSVDHTASPTVDADALQSETAPALAGGNRPFPSIPGYRVEKELGRGGMGVVYLAHHAKLKRAVALKLIRGGADAEHDQLQRFRIEAQAVAQLQHPNIVAIYEVGEHDG